jgi:hypothetical protein
MNNNLYQPTFEMDESFRVNRWARPSEEGYDTMGQYTLGGLHRQYRDTMNTVKSGAGESQRRYVTEVSQTSNAAELFRKTKFNQMETLKELRQ